MSALPAGAPAWSPSPWSPPPPQPWSSPPPPPEAPAEPKPEGVTDAGLPLDQRGFVGLDTASFTDAGGHFSAVQLRLLASIPLKSHLFLDARLPLGFATLPRTSAVLGNAMLGVHGVVQVGKATWITAGGALGLPLLSGRSQDNNGYMSVQVPRAFWDLHEYLPSIVPIEGRLGVEGHLGSVILRGDLGAILSFPIGESDQVELAIQHAVEVQVGHALGGGLRLQGVALPTFADQYKNSYTEGDLYQLAIEPFLALEQRLVSARVGIMLPVDKALGPPFAGSYGFHLGAGVRLP